MGTASVQDLIGRLAFSLTRAGYFMATAESCTGGMIASWCTDIAGSSAWFKGGIVSYSNEMKRDILDVGQELLLQYGAVSAPVAQRMALGALRVAGADAAVAVSGIAGPTGGSPEKPVGTVWIAAAVKERTGVCAFDETDKTLASLNRTRVKLGTGEAVVATMKRLFTGNRAAVRHGAAETALRALYTLLEQGMIP
jgi:PncC family amidohydrolase